MLSRMKSTDYALFTFCGLHIAVAIGYLIPLVAQGVRDRCHNSWSCARHIRANGVDLADGQWREFRNSLHLLVGACILTSVVSYLLRIFTRSWSSRAQQQANVILRLLIGLIVLAVQHGYHSCIIVGLAVLGYAVAKVKFGGWEPVVIWSYGISVLLFKESYRLRHLPSFQFLTPLFDRRYGGLYGWQLPANFLVLRIVSFGLDRYWASQSAGNGKKANDKQVTDDNTALPVDQYSLLNYLAYVLYAPLYMAGPIATYISFVRCLSPPPLATDPQNRLSNGGADQDNIDSNLDPTKSTPSSGNSTNVGGENVWLYALRWVLCLGLMEYLLRQYPFFAVAASGLITSLTPAQTAVTSYLLLKLMWLKFLLLWRFFRLWALLDGVTPPENMTRCMSNNYSLEGFWRGWHSSFNRFLVRYLYKPLGGRQTQLFSVWLIFVFVALWHDFEWKLFVWGGANAFFYAIEVSVKRAVQQSRVLDRLPAPAAALVCAMSGAVYIMVLVCVNLVGYGVGVGGVTTILAKITSPEGMQTGAVCFYFLTIAVLLMQLLERVGWTVSKP